jgi:poly-beta-1,6-N-acetyl-D-glucosamine synthase
MIETLVDIPTGAESSTHLRRYVLVTAAYNEESFLARTIDSVVLQTVLPAKWVIVSDGSTDRTDEIVRQFSARHQYIRLLRVERSHLRGVVSKVNALNRGLEELRGVEHDFVGNLDADVFLPPSYFEVLMARFRSNPTLGISGGLIWEERGGGFRGRVSNRITSVAHAAQLVRRECYQEIGGYRPLKYGGEDWCAEVSARMKGWRVEAIPDLQVMHYRPTGAADRMLLHCFRQGKMDFSVGSHPVFEMLKCVRRVGQRPIAICALARFAGFCWSSASREPRLVSPEFVRFLRIEQKNRLKLSICRPGVDV